MSLSNALVAQILNERFTAQTHWLALHISDPTNAGLATSELSAVNYARQQVNWSLPSNRGVANTNNITYSGLPAVTVPYLAVWSSRTGGTIHAVLECFPVYRTTSNGSTIYVPSSSIVVEVI
jgi:hypothetical protein